MTLRKPVFKAAAGLAALGLALGLAAGPALAHDEPDELAERARRSAETLRELLDADDSDLPSKLLADARCVAVIPKVVKAAFLFGGRHGEGYVSCRSPQGWSRPSAIKISGGSFGLQAGVEATDMVLVFMNRHAIERLQDDNITLGGNASVAAGPVGRTAEANTDYKLDSEIYVYSRSKGAFAGVSLEGAKLDIDEENNAMIYGSELGAAELLSSSGPQPQLVAPFVQALERLVPPRASEPRM